jgi:hypothetical protein
MLAIGGLTLGPYTMSQIVEMCRSGIISDGALYWREGMKDWAPLAALLGIVPPAMPSASTTRQPVRVQYVAAKDAFTGTLPLLVRLAVKAVHTVGYTLENASESVGIITFRTGMTWGSWSGAVCSIVIEDVGEDWFIVSGAGKQNLAGGQFIALDLFGEAKSKANKVIAMMKQLAR